MGLLFRRGGVGMLGCMLNFEFQSRLVGLGGTVRSESLSRI